MFEWDKPAALQLIANYKKFWGPTKNSEYGITGKPDANTGKANAKSVYQTVMNHGKQTIGRGVKGFIGAGDILLDLIEIIDEPIMLEEHILDIKKLIDDLGALEKNPKRNPQNILFRTMVDFKAPKGDEKPKIKRGFSRGHFLTPAYWDYRTWNAKQTGQEFSSVNPKGKNWSVQGETENTVPLGKAKPPLWQAIFGPENSLRVLIAGVIELIDKQKAPPVVNLSVNANLGAKTGAVQMATITGLNKAIREVMADGSIYARGTKIAVKDRLNQAISRKTFTINQSDLKILVENCTVQIDGEKIEIDEVVNYETINNVSLKFPANNKTLNKIVREVMGEEMNTYKVPNSTQSDGITLKQLDAMTAFSNLMKVMK